MEQHGEHTRPGTRAEVSGPSKTDRRGSGPSPPLPPLAPTSPWVTGTTLVAVAALLVLLAADGLAVAQRRPWLRATQPAAENLLVLVPWLYQSGAGLLTAGDGREEAKATVANFDRWPSGGRPSEINRWPCVEPGTPAFGFLGWNHGRQSVPSCPASGS